jgi:phage terminase large subunit-like protein
MKWLYERILNRKLRHGGNEVLNWHAACAGIRVDGNGNIGLQKRDLDREGKRIDGIAAIVTASYRAMLLMQLDPYSNGVRVYSA